MEEINSTSETQETEIPEAKETKIVIPDASLVVLVGPTGCGKSTFAAKHFKPTEILSSDVYRRVVADEEANAASADAFAVMKVIATKRLNRGLVTVLDATHVQAGALDYAMTTARECYAQVNIIAFNFPERVVRERAGSRSDRTVPMHVLDRHLRQMRVTVKQLRKMRFGKVRLYTDPTIVDTLKVERRKSVCDYRNWTGPFDIIGDVHGCYEELIDLLVKLGYMPVSYNPPMSVDPAYYPETKLVNSGPVEVYWTHPQGRKVIFVGDLFDRGPYPVKAFDLARMMVRHGQALFVAGNHEDRLPRKLNKKRADAWLKEPAALTHGLETTLLALLGEPEEDLRKRLAFIRDLPPHVVLDNGSLIVTHAAVREDMLFKNTEPVRKFCQHGPVVPGAEDEFGLPVRIDWAKDYKGRARIVYGHYHVGEPRIENNAICIDTQAPSGGKLTAYRYPEDDFVSVPAKQCYYVDPAYEAQQKKAAEEAAQGAGVRKAYRDPDLLDIKTLIEERQVFTDLAGVVFWRPNEAAAALEQLSRSGVDPKWLIYLPPTMSPCETAPVESPYLEHPYEAFNYFKTRGVKEVVCEEKHMGSRMIVVACRDEEVAKRRFRVPGGVGVCYSRLGRPFFRNPEVERQAVDAVREGMTKAGLWDELKTDWICLDGELMPWNAKAVDLLRNQYGATGASGEAILKSARDLLLRANDRGVPVIDIANRTADRLYAVRQFTRAYETYCWPVNGFSGLTYAPFHIMATEGAVHSDKDHGWHLYNTSRMMFAGSEHPFLYGTRSLKVSVENADEAVHWWDNNCTLRGSEGMVVKSFDFIPGKDDRQKPIQPMLKCRGAEYLRIIYGPEYLIPGNLDRLRSRSTGRKRDLAIKEFALGLEGLKRFVQKEPLLKVHQCVFGILAMECEPVDPRL